MSDGTVYALFTDIVAPTIGFFTTNLLMLSPHAELKERSHKGSIRDFNIFPIVMLPINCMAWVFYSLVSQATTLSALFVFWTNLPGVLLGFYYITLLFMSGDVKPKEHKQVITTLGLGISLNVITLMTCCILLDSDEDAETKQLLFGSIATLLMLIFYGSPLLLLSKVIKTKDSSSFSVPLASTTCVNGLVWVIFGWFTLDYFLFFSNLVGIILALIQLACIFIYPGKEGGYSPIPEERKGEQNGGRKPSKASNNESPSQSLLD